MATTDQVIYIFRAFNQDEPDKAVTEAIAHALRNSVGLVNAKLTAVEYSDLHPLYAASEDFVPEIRITVTGS